MIIDLGYDYERMLSNLRGFYSGVGYIGALITLDRARDKHNGLRKDGFPEFSHQVMQASMLRNLPDIMNPELVHVIVLAHDLDEDYDVTTTDTRVAIEDGIPVSRRVKDGSFEQLEFSLGLMNKYHSPSGRPKGDDHYYAEIARDPNASIAKGLDIDHNLGSMLRAFTPEKMQTYAADKQKYGLPMLKAARKRFPSQAAAYHLLDQQIRYKLFMIDAYLSVVGRGQASV